MYAKFSIRNAVVGEAETAELYWIYWG